MGKELRIGFVTLSMFVLTACGSVEPPSTPPSDKTSFPPLADSGFASYTTVRTFPLPIAQSKTWFETDARIVKAMESTENIAKPVGIVVLEGIWPEAGSVRRVELSDGHFTMERVIEHDEDTFSYQIWGLTSAAGQNIEQVYGEQSWTNLPNGQSQLSWSYNLKPNAAYKKPFVKKFVKSDITPFLDTALDKVMKDAETELK